MLVNVDKHNESLFSRKAQMKVEEDDDGYRVKVDVPEGRPMELRDLPSMVRGMIEDIGGGRWIYTPSSEVTLELTVPRRMSVNLSTAYGDIAEELTSIEVQ